MFQYYLLKIGGPVTHNWCPKLPNLGGYVLLLLLELLTFRHFTEESLKNVKIDGLTGRETSHLFFFLALFFPDVANQKTIILH